jgi:hypothetical protein
MSTQDTAIRKRQQIANANRMMLIWVAAISAIVGIAIVASIFLLQKAWFNEKVLAEKGKTASTLTENNEALKASMAQGEDQPIQVVLDALPSDVNSSAFGSSLQEKFLSDPKLAIESLVVDPVAGVESQNDENIEDASSDADSSGENQITFRFAVSSDVNDANALKSLLQKLERSIRAIDITMMTVETQGNRLVLTVDGHAFYEPAKTVELQDKVVKP